MPGFTLHKNSVFEWNGAGFRIDRLQPNGELLLERLSDGQVISKPREDLLSEFTKGRIQAQRLQPLAGDKIPPTYSRPLEDLPEKTKSETARRWHYVQALLESSGFVFTPHFMRAFIKEAASRIQDKSPPSVTSLYRWYRSYRRDRDTRALIPRTDRRGKRLPHQDNEILTLLSEALQEAYAASPLTIRKSVHVRLLGKVQLANRMRASGNQLICPSIRTVYRLLSRVEIYEQIRLREGAQTADKRLRLSKGSTTTENILERVEVDHTPLDLFLIDERTKLPLGRPTLTVIIDHFSRMLLGYHLSFDNPSTAAVMGALRHAILPKDPIIETVPNLPCEHSWPSYGIPDVLVADNGLEFHGRDLESVCFDLGIRIQYCPKHQPRFKGAVERYLKTINYFLAHQLPGTSFARLHQRGDYDPQKHALLTLEEFKHIFEKWVLDVYAQQVHKTLGVTPWARWEEGLTRRTPGLPSDLHDLQRRIGLVQERALRREGIWVNGIRYVGGELQPILNAYGEGVRVRVLFDPEDLGTIQVWGPDQEMPITIHAVNQEYAHQLTLRQNNLIRANLRAQGEASQDSVALQRAKHDLAISVQTLMASKKQRHRRKAAAINGASSSNPKAELVTPVTPEQKKIPERLQKQNTPDELLMVRFPSFNVKP